MGGISTIILGFGSQIVTTNAISGVDLVRAAPWDPKSKSKVEKESTSHQIAIRLITAGVAFFFFLASIVLEVHSSLALRSKLPQSPPVAPRILCTWQWVPFEVKASCRSAPANAAPASLNFCKVTAFTCNTVRSISARR